MKLLFIGGSFDENGGKPSGIVRKIAALLAEKNEIVLYNGGYFSDLENHLQECSNYEVTFWFANVPNHLPKMRDVKAINPKTILVTSKRNNGEYSFQEIINRALSQKANLLLEFTKVEGTLEHQICLYDPLGVEWYHGSDIAACTAVLERRLNFLRRVVRQETNHVDGEIDIPDNPEFFELIRLRAEVFHILINPAKEVTRFLGNSSYRCQRGFPSFKKDNLIFVSARNIDKRFISRENFVPTYLENYKVFYGGDKKPSVDTPVQLRLYHHFENINYMLHSHCYIDGGIFTTRPVPCGGLQEVDEIINAVADTHQDFYAINLIGHGSLLMSKEVAPMKNVKYYSRPTPEILNLL